MQVKTDMLDLAFTYFAQFAVLETSKLLQSSALCRHITRKLGRHKMCNMQAIIRCRSLKLYIFLHPRSHNNTMQAYFGMQADEVAKTQTYSIMCRFPLSVVLCDHNSPTLQSDRWTSCL